MYLTQCQLWLPSLSYLSLCSCQVMFVTKDLSAFSFLSGEVLLTSELWWWLSYSMCGSNHLLSDCRSWEGSHEYTRCGRAEMIFRGNSFPWTISLWVTLFFEDSPRICAPHWQQPSPRAFSGRMLWNRLVRAQGTTEHVYVSGQK